MMTSEQLNEYEMKIQASERASRREGLRYYNRDDRADLHVRMTACGLMPHGGLTGQITDRECALQEELCEVIEGTLREVDLTEVPLALVWHIEAMQYDDPDAFDRINDLQVLIESRRSELERTSATGCGWGVIEPPDPLDPDEFFE